VASTRTNHRRKSPAAIRRQAELEVEAEDRFWRRVIIGGPIILVLLALFVYFQWVIEAEIARHPWLAGPLGFFVAETTGFTVLGLFIVIYVDTLFFVLFPGEIYFFFALAAGVPPVLAVAAAGAAGALGQISNYWMGRYARRKGKGRPRAQKVLAFAEKANGKGGRFFLAFALAVPAPEVIGFAYGLGNFPAKAFMKYAAVFRPLKWVLLYLAFVFLRDWLAVFGV
jgi:membrane protein YqaA with SNARE-associated domain